MKLVDNVFHTTKIVFENEIMRISHDMTLDQSVLHEAFVADTKLDISRNYLRTGGAFSDSRLLKDTKIL